MAQRPKVTLAILVERHRLKQRRDHILRQRQDVIEQMDKLVAKFDNLLPTVLEGPVNDSEDFLARRIIACTAMEEASTTFDVLIDRMVTAKDWHQLHSWNGPSYLDAIAYVQRHLTGSSSSSGVGDEGDCGLINCQRDGINGYHNVNDDDDEVEVNRRASSVLSPKSNRMELSFKSSSSTLSTNELIVSPKLAAQANFSFKPLHEETQILVRKPVVPQIDVRLGQYSVAVSHIRSPTCFFVQINETAASEQIWKLQPTQNALLKDIGSFSATDIKPDMLVAGRFKDDKLWYRAKVISVQNGSKVHVYYVDYGNEGHLDLKDVMSLAQEFVELPALCIRCSLRDIDVALQDYDLDAITKQMKKLTLYEEKILARFSDSYVVTDSIERSIVYTAQLMIGEKHLDLVTELLMNG